MKKIGSSKGVIILTFTNICSKFLSLLYMPLLTAAIGEFGFGVYSKAYNIYVFVYMVTIAGISTAIPKMIATYISEGFERDAFSAFKVGRGISILTGTVMTLVLFVFAKPASAFLGSKESYMAILMLCPSIFFTSIVSAYRGYFQGKSRLNIIGISQFIEQILNVIFSVLCAYMFMGYGVEYGVAGGALGTAVGALAALIYLKVIYLKDIKIKRQSKKKKYDNKYLIKYMVKYSIPLILSTIFISGSNLIDIGFINSGLVKSGLSNKGATILYAYFTQYMQIINTPMIIITALSIYILPLIARENTKEDKGGLKISIGKLINLGFLISIPAAIGMAILSKEIFTVILGSNGMGAAKIMSYGSAVFVVLAVYFLTNTMMNSLGMVKEGVFTSFIGIVIKIVCDFVFIPISFFNIYGAVIGLFLSNFVMVIMNMRIIENYIKEKGILRKAWIKPAIAAIVMAIIVIISKFIIIKLFKLILGIYFGNLMGLIITVYLGAISYIKVMVALEGIESEIIEAVPNRLKPLLGMDNIIIKEI